MEEIKKELTQIFAGKNIFPATKGEIMDFVLETNREYDRSPEVLNWVEKLDGDEDYKYQSLDDILPQPNNFLYPMYYIWLGDHAIKIINESDYFTASKYGFYKVPGVRDNVFMFQKEGERVSREKWKEFYDRLYADFEKDIFS